uniref:Titin n=1 Tax=Oryzias latipes TaxID=8090 RepID=A0A3P9HGT5_ORYLA
MDLDASVKEKIVVHAGGTIRIIAYVSGKPAPQITWCRDDGEVPKEAAVEQTGISNSLVIKNCRRQHQGIYTLSAKNEGGERRKAVIVECFFFNVLSTNLMTEPPELILDAGMTREVKAMAGTHITLMATIKGAPFPKVIWKKNDADVPTRADIETNQSGTKLEMRFCNRDDCGDYTLTVENPAGSKTVTCTVLVLGKRYVTFRERPTASELPAIMRGIPVPTAKWSIEGEEITSEGNIKIDTDNFSTILSINECTRTHTGTYLLTVSNAAGSKTVGLNVTVLDVPAAPIGPVNILEVTPDSMTIEWRPPKEDGGSPITNYIVDKRESNKETWGGVSSGSLGTELKITRLQRGAEYVVRIRAENKMGVGAPLESKPTVAEHSFMPPSPPGKPQSYDLSEDSVTVGWTMPLADGGSQITGYLIERRHKGGKWIRVNRIPCKDLRYRVLGLFEGNEYEFRVFAENIAGYSGPSPISDPCKPCRPITVPRPPINPKIKDYSKTTADLVWTKPSKDGGSPILGYTVEMRKGDAEEWKKVNLDDFIKLCAYQVKGLEEGVAYKFRVYASNMVGDGEAKEIPDSIVAQDILIPPEIEMDAACRDKDEMTVVWAPPENDGGKSITGYILERKEKRAVRWVACTKSPISERRMKVTNLIPNHEYQFRVKAENEVGLGDPSKACRPVAAKDPIGEFTLNGMARFTDAL